MTGIRTFWSWWSHRLAELVPSWLERFAFRPETIHTLVKSHDDWLFLRSRGTKRDRRYVRLKTGDVDGLRKLVRKRAVKRLAVRLPVSDFFSRNISLPIAAKANAQAIIHADTQRSLPFGEDDILSGFAIAAGTGSPVQARQLIIKKERLPDLGGIGFSHVEAYETNPLAPLDIEVGAKPIEKQRASWSSNFVASMLAIIVATSAAFVATEISRKELAVEQLKIRVAIAKRAALKRRQQVNAMRTQASELARLHGELSSKVKVTSILEELSLAIPDSAWVQRVRIRDSFVFIAGFAKSSSNLVVSLERSPKFEAVKFVAPVTVDQSKQQESFAIQLKLTTEDRVAVSDTKKVGRKQ